MHRDRRQLLAVGDITHGIDEGAFMPILPEQAGCSKSRQPDAGTRRLIPLTRWPDFHPWPTVSALRHLRFHQESNGFKRAFRTVGRRVLIDEVEFFDAVDQQHARNGQ